MYLGFDWSCSLCRSVDGTLTNERQAAGQFYGLMFDRKRRESPGVRSAWQTAMILFCFYKSKCFLHKTAYLIIVTCSNSFWYVSPWLSSFWIPMKNNNVSLSFKGSVSASKYNFITKYKFIFVTRCSSIRHRGYRPGENGITPYPRKPQLIPLVLLYRRLEMFDEPSPRSIPRTPKLHTPIA